MDFQLDIQVLAVGAALAIRFAVLAATLPLLDLRSVPPVWRVALAICFSALLTPAVNAGLAPGTLDLSWQGLVLEAAKSVVLGALMGFTVNLVFTAVRYAGSIAGMQIGFAIVNAFDPMTMSQVSIIAQLYYIMAVLLFFVTGAHQILVAAMFQSCVVVPPFVGLDPAAGSWFLLKEFGTIFELGLRISAPIVVVLLLVSAAMGVVVKTVPQLNVLAVGFPIKIGVGLITFGLSLVFFREVAVGLMARLPDQLDQVLMALR